MDNKHYRLVCKQCNRIYMVLLLYFYWQSIFYLSPLCSSIFVLSRRPLPLFYDELIMFSSIFMPYIVFFKVSQNYMNYRVHRFSKVDNNILIDMNCLINLKDSRMVSSRFLPLRSHKVNPVLLQLPTLPWFCSHTL